MEIAELKFKINEGSYALNRGWKILCSDSLLSILQNYITHRLLYMYEDNQMFSAFYKFVHIHQLVKKQI